MDKACMVSVGRLQMQVWLGVDLQKHTERLEELQPKAHGSKIADVMVKCRLKIIKSVGFLVAVRKEMNIRSPGERPLFCTGVTETNPLADKPSKNKLSSKNQLSLSQTNCK